MGRLTAILSGACRNLLPGPGPAVAAYEQDLRDYFGAADALVYWKGRVALYAMLRGLGVGQGDEVLMPGYTCVVVPNAVLYAGATPVYVDIDPQSYNLTAQAVEKALTPRTKALIVQHSYGLPADLDPILELARSRGLPVLEDCCHAFGSRYRGRLVGTLGAGGFFSAQWSKPFSTGLGGIAVINDPLLAARVRRITEAEAVDPGWTPRLLLSAELLVFHLLVFPRTIGLATNAFRFLGSRGLLIGSSSKQELVGRLPAGYFQRLSAGQAAVGSFELRRCQRNFDHRRQLVALYDRLFRQAGWPTPAVAEHTQPVLVRYPLPVANKTELLRLAEKHLIELGDWFACPLHGAETALDHFGFQADRCPVSVQAGRQVINLPLHLRVGEAAARRTVEFVLRYGQRT